MANDNVTPSNYSDERAMETDSFISAGKNALQFSLDRLPFEKLSSAEAERIGRAIAGVGALVREITEKVHGSTDGDDTILEGEQAAYSEKVFIFPEGYLGESRSLVCAIRGISLALQEGGIVEQMTDEVSHLADALDIVSKQLHEAMCRGFNVPTEVFEAAEMVLAAKRG